jgi:transcriptional regulator with XRE-family HTH domain
MPKASGRVDHREREIAMRVRRVRLINQLSVSKFAKVLEVSANKVAGVEYGRTPLAVNIADKIAAHFDVNLSWLATGAGRMKPSIGQIAKIEPEINGSLLLSGAFSEEMYQRLLQSYKFNFLAADAILSDGVDLPKGKPGEKYLDEFYLFLDDRFRELPHPEKEKLLTLLIRLTARFNTSWHLGRRDFADGVLEFIKNQSLTDITLSSNTLGVKSEIDKLIERVKRKAERPGAKAELARALGVAPARISEWLSGEKEPGGEYTLRLLKWVE